MAAARSDFAIGTQLRVIAEDKVGRRIALIMLGSPIPNDGCGKNSFCCSALARLQELSKL
jgi:hypothetical protein